MNISPILWILVAFWGINAKKFSVIQEQPTILAKVGEDVFISCIFTANIQSKIWSYTWYKDGRNGTEVSNGTAEYRGRIYRSKGDILQDASIVIRDVRVNDSGVYYCKVLILPLGEEYGAGTWLTVRERKAEFQVNQELRNIQAVEEQTVLIPCTHTAPTSAGKGTFQWYKNARNGTEVSNGTAEYKGRIFRPEEEDGRTASIQIRNLKLNDSGLYYCLVNMKGHVPEYGAGTHLTVKEKTKPTAVLLLILLVSTVVELGVFLSVAFYCLRLRRVKNLRKAQRQSTIIPEIACMDESIMPLQFETEQDLDANQEQSIYTPMESLRTFNNSTDNLTDSQSCPLISQTEPTASEPLQYATIKMDLLKKSPSSLNVTVQRNNSEHDYGYDELNITAKRDPLPVDISVNQVDAADSESSAAEINGWENEDLEINVQC